MKKLATFGFAIVLACLSVACAQQGEVADTIYTNGRIYTVNEAEPWVEAVAIADGKFLVVGSNADVEAVTGEGTEVVDLGGRFVMPGLHDLHLHFEGFYTSKALEGKSLRYTTQESSIEELQAKLKDYADANPELDVLFAEQLPQALFPNLSPTRQFIDEIVPDRVVVMLSDSEHEALLNTKALEKEGITVDTKAPFGGEIVRDPETDEPTGWLKESAAGKWGWPYFPQLTREQHEEGMRSTVKMLNSLGVTTAKEQHAKDYWAQGFQDVEADGDLTMRIGLSWTYKGPLEPSSIEDQENTIEERHRFASDLISTEFVKLSIDGTLGTTGLVVDPYLESGGYGIAFYRSDELADDVTRFDAMGIGITAHANGDGAVRQFLDALEEAKRRNGGELKARHQVAHAVGIHPEDLPRFKELNVTAEFSPISWMPSALSEGLSPEIGPDRMEHIFPMKSLADHGGRFVLASDGPLMWQVPLQAIESAVTRQAPDGGEQMLAPDERIDLAMAIRAYTIEPAYLMSHENEVGSIEAGKLADMIVLDQNLFELPSNEIAATEVVLTIFNREVVYERP